MVRCESTGYRFGAMGDAFHACAAAVFDRARTDGAEEPNPPNGERKRFSSEKMCRLL